MVVAVTGGIASGKTTLTDFLKRQHGIQVFDADAVARDLVAPGMPSLQVIAKRFGQELLTQDGELNRQLLRSQVFADPAKRMALESILHPLIQGVLRDRSHQASGPYAIVAIPLLAESQRYEWLDRIVVVDVERETQLNRIMHRDRVDRAAGEAILAAQASRQDRLLIADDVLINDGTTDLFTGRADKLHQRLMRAALARSQQ